jgi:hypothetical protein
MIQIFLILQMGKLRLAGQAVEKLLAALITEIL